MCRAICRTATQRITAAIILRDMSWFVIFAVVLVSVVGLMQAAESEQYLRSIKPLLIEKCITCHGALRAEAGLRLDAIQLIREGITNGTSSPADKTIIAKLLDRITSHDIDFRMPPEDAGSQLTDKQVELLSEWANARFPGPSEESFLASPREHWAYQPIVKPTLPKVKQVDSINPIDRLITAASDARGVRPLNESVEAVWLRRVTFDVTGLPPTVDELQNFLADRSKDKKQKVLDHVLSQESYGERWGRHWMDIWRYSDWDGYKEELRTSQRHIWHWRDWIVESLNANKPYDRMILEMLAADEIAPQDQQTLRATGFLARNYHKSNRNIWLDATVEHTAKAFLGMTLNCAKCHDHKYDPLPQTSYYQFRALFEPHKIRTDQILGEPRIEKNGIPRSFDEDLRAETFVYARGDDKKPIKESPVQAAVPAFFQIPFEITPIPLPLESYNPELSDRVRQNVIAEKVEAEKSALADLNANVTLLNDGVDKANATQIDERVFVDLDLAIAKLKVAQTDRSSTQARYEADAKKYELELKCLPSTASGSNTVIGPIRQSAGNDLNRQPVTMPSLYSVRKIFDANRRGNVWNDWLPLARRAADLEYSHKLAVAKYDLLVKERVYGAVMNSVEKETDMKKREASIQTAKVEFDKSLSTLAQLATKREIRSTEYTPIGKELPRHSSGRRSALANWIIHPDNPLTARVAINHIWLRHFGTPLVENTFDFGMSSPKPELLDLHNWLSAELIQSHWDMKHIHRLILLSDVYARASDETESDLYQANAKLDPENITYWRANTRRLDAEEIRDSMLAVSKQLDRQLGGPDIHFADGETIMRRSLYFRHAYEKQMPMLVLFDAASPNECYRRKPSLIPQQALSLANSSLARSLAHKLAENCTPGLKKDSSLNEETESEFVNSIFLTALCRQPTDQEHKACLNFLNSQTALLLTPEQLTRFDENVKVADDKLSPAVKARRSLAIVLFNHHDFVTIR
jgi:Protein of unknown function (DUF1553)/Protein of unknown function (DUF1549)/Planctomycete cytochrome C